MEPRGTNKSTSVIRKECYPYNDPALLPVTVFIPRPPVMTISTINAGIRELLTQEIHIAVSVVPKDDGNLSLGDILADPARDIIVISSSYLMETPHDIDVIEK